MAKTFRKFFIIFNNDERIVAHYVAFVRCLPLLVEDVDWLGFGDGGDAGFNWRLDFDVTDIFEVYNVGIRA